MLDIDRFDHIGIRVSDKNQAVAFYESLGFVLVADGGFDAGHPLVMLHPSGININLLGLATAGGGSNILMDAADKYPGITHVALQVRDAAAAQRHIEDLGIAITGRRDFEGVQTIFIRDPDRNVLELVGPGPTVADLIVRHVGENQHA